MLGKKTVESIMAPFAKIKSDLDALIDERRVAISKRSEKIALLDSENIGDQVEINRASKAAERIAAIGI
jgi:hypothetical protein